MEITRRPSMVSVPLVARIDTKHTGPESPPSIQGGPAASTPVPTPTLRQQNQVVLDVAPQGPPATAPPPGEHILWRLADDMVGDLRDLAHRVEHHASPAGAYQLVTSNPRAVLAATAVVALGGFAVAALAITGKLP